LDKQQTKGEKVIMRYGSVCSGVEAATLAWHQMGWKCVFVSEVEPFPCAVLQERFGASRPIHPLDPAEATSEDDRKMRKSWIAQNQYLKEEGVLPNEGDFTKIGKKYENQIDLLVGGTPCQDLSVAGKRAGFDGERSSLANGVGAQEEIAYTQNATGVMGVCTSTVRRLLPIECERLMGFPDDWTKIPWKGKSVEDCPDSPRYKACGNSMCVNVMRWIGEQIQKVEEKCNGI
jgi:site-specific DNA-cytosine methylase